MSLSETMKGAWLIVTQFGFVAIVAFAAAREYLLGNVTNAAEAVEVGMIVMFLIVSIGYLSLMYDALSSSDIEEPTQPTK